jgi:transcription antitermination factor NusG
MPVLPLEPFLFPESLFEAIGTSEPDAGRWWVLQTRPRMEKCVARKLLRANVPFFLPLYTRRWRTQGRWVCSHMPLFTGYLFLHGQSEARLAALQTNLIALCLHVEDQPQLQSDLERVYRLITSGTALTPEDRLRVGDWVQIASGPLEGMEGKIIRQGNKLRFCVEVNLLQCGVSVDIERSMLRAITRTPQLQTC